MLKKELLFHLFITTPSLSIAQAAYAANLAMNVQEPTLGYDWILLFFIYLLLHIPVNAILSFAFFGISSWLKKVTLNLLVFNVIGLAGVGVLLFLQKTDAIYVYSSFFVMSVISILVHQKNQKSA
ncbi:hypothetical protein [Paenibacillus tarimensis]|uniref:hypothetical protein n=1 Tax=Paenibacillus tarimensis TaxID=416012 RepID=UPI001F2A5F1A|nr:hypothetical protein [Paenibacillus tarimensis]MCF2945378.1 hypothetical protein [Paenibacillus tarimensis]